MNKIKWTYESCYEVAKDCYSRREFQKKNGSAYYAARINGWLDDYMWFEKKRHDNWTRETCYEAAKDCHSRKEFANKNSGAYDAARRNKWLDDYTWFKAVREYHEPWTRETCYEAAKDCYSRKEFEKKSKGAYYVAWKNGWLDDYTWFKRRKDPFANKMDNVYAYFFKSCNAVYVGRTINLNRRNKEHYTEENSSVFKFAAQHNIPIPEMTILEKGLSLEDGLVKEDYYCNKFKEEGWELINKAKTGIGSGSLGGMVHKWNYKSCYEVAKDCHNRNEFANKSRGAYKAARINGWLDDYMWFEKAFEWTYETCYEAAKDCHSRKEFANKNSGAYKVACKNGWLDDYMWFEKAFEWAYEECYNIAKDCHSRSEFAKKSSGAYAVALKNGWFDDYTWFDRLHHEPWAYEECYNIAKDCHNRMEFKKKNNGAYQAAWRNGWFDDYTWFERLHHDPWTYEECYNIAKDCHSRNDFQKKSRGAYKAACRNKWLDEFFQKVS